MKEDKKDYTKVAVCVPAYQTLPIMFVTALMDLLARMTKKYAVHTMIQDVIPIDEARNRCVKFALDKEVKYLLFLDSDNIPNPTMFGLLMETMEQEKADLVTGMYFEKAKPYFPVIRSYREEWGFRKIENPKMGEIVPIGGCGMGCALIKMEVFKELKPPWFMFEYEEVEGKMTQLSEDLYFCRKMCRAGKRMICDTKVIAPHLGSIADGAEYYSFIPFRKKLTEARVECVKDIIEFTGESEVNVQDWLYTGHLRMARMWNEANPQTPEEVREFYRLTDGYLYDLALWHFTNRRKFDIDLLVACTENYKPRNILDYGAGIGQNAIILAREGFDVTMAELDSITFDFAKYRFEEHGVPCKTWTVDKEELPPDEKYDLIVALDVLEHIPDEEFEWVLKKLISLKHEKTVVITTNTFGKSHIHPMHFEYSEEKRKLISELVGREVL